MQSCGLHALVQHNIMIHTAWRLFTLPLLPFFLCLSSLFVCKSFLLSALFEQDFSVPFFGDTCPFLELISGRDCVSLVNNPLQSPLFKVHCVADVWVFLCMFQQGVNYSEIIIPLFFLTAGPPFCMSAACTPCLSGYVSVLGGVLVSDMGCSQAWPHVLRMSVQITAASLFMYTSVCVL